MPPLPVEPLPLQPSIAPAPTMKIRASKVSSRQRRRGTKPRNRNAANTLPAFFQSAPSRAELLAAVVETVNVVEAPEFPVMVVCAGLRLQVGVSVAVPWPEYVTLQVRLTVPVNPPAEVN